LLDEDDFCVGGGEDVAGSVLILEEEEDEDVIDLLVVDQTGGSNLAPCGGCGQCVIGVHRYPGCSAYMHVLCGGGYGCGGG